ncbi:MAG: DUF29 domain-containing protein [Microcoleus sp. PH2017_40_RAT_O_B]|jgi:hypothetical protein|uniref:DUF29 domain-containing protein n=1 Tax=unclassified Microcoleus TaxID=2642155 RepID=UPI001D83352E|nr:MULTISPECIES: DUF29 domain-containing protein [unclassified Microcoleus]TAG12854.1 MAG: DUF29 domain-containing protein [Oscillatoriales cyanobacterium]MCC3437092.1 DUF29 domain-containing protein [Microcoleus sp. PH2017_05_CCC_O_A]MCC3571829.1 DUF29 domain-containing protein [Microcoleus sp. PH2017_34_RAT_O_A]MCC3609456.1 DUF29 domain-containing protein [Microcoleus sp. PH2017_40_RAT_O_B]TAG36700.1 MAG: DUF29 domain-containing protein [Oscillatoriales cyanobacterium]
MTTKLEVDRHKLYDTDYLRWIETTVEKLRARDYSNIDWENLIEEIEDMGRSERRSLESNLVVIILHLLKWQFQPDRRSGSWKASIAEHRRRIRKAVKDSPSLRPYLEEVLAECYADAVEQASAETGLSIETFPQLSVYTSTEVLDSNFLPDEIISK